MLLFWRRNLRHCVTRLFYGAMKMWRMVTDWLFGCFSACQRTDFSEHGLGMYAASPTEVCSFRKA